MKKQDIIFALFVVLLFAPFVFYKPALDFYSRFNSTHGMLMSFIKFGLLATMGESIGLRIKKGVYNQKGFGLLPRALTWGIFGLIIKLAFTVFASGAPVFAEYIGINGAVQAMHNNFSTTKLLGAFTISLTLNLIFSPVFMTLHKVTDTHIINNGGTMRGYFSRINPGEIIANINWDVHYNFVLKRTIPLFWIPAHTLTFLLPPDYQILMAALLGVALGVILSVATLKSESIKTDQ